jgi:hypothetical protein
VGFGVNPQPLVIVDHSGLISSLALCFVSLQQELG